QSLRWQQPPAPGAAARPIPADVRDQEPPTMADAKTPAKKYYLGTGRRKTAVARVRLGEGSGRIEINGRGLDDYFTEVKDRQSVLGPLQLAEMSNRLDLLVTVHGGGFTGQA